MDQVNNTSSDIKPLASTLLIAIVVHTLILVNWNIDWKPATPADALSTSHSWISLNLMPVPNSIDSVAPHKAPSPGVQAHKTQKAKPDITELAENTQKKHSEAISELELNPQSSVDNDSVIEQDAIVNEISNPVLVVENRAHKLQYMQILLARIEQHKYYPRIALRRGITGDVDVKLSLDNSGHIVQLDTNSQHSSLSNATRRAIQSAQPLPLPENNQLYPVKLEFSISYKII